MGEFEEITPASERCDWGGCPALFEEITPATEKCAIGATCPALYEHDAGIWVIGKLPAIPEAIKARVGPDEGAVWVPKGLLKNIRWKPCYADASPMKEAASMHDADRREFIRLWQRLHQLERIVMATFDRLEADIAAQTTVVAGVVALLGTLAQQVRDLGGPKAAELADKIEANTNSLTAAVTTNTPVANEPVPTA